MNELVSVIIPVYNVENYIDRCMESVLGQTYTNLEIIMIDDGSKDNSGKIIDAYAAKDSRISVVHKENGGQASARNLGVSKATGDYVCFVDSDDCIHEKFVETLLTMCHDTGCDLAICTYEDFTGESTDWKRELPDASVKIETPLETLDAIFSPRNVETIVVWNKMYKLSNIKNVKFTEGRIFEDEEVSARLIYASTKVARVEKPMYYYFQNNSGTMGGEFTLKKLDILWALETRMQFFKDNGLTKLYYKDAYKYMCKLLTHYYRVGQMQEKHPEIQKEIMEKYHKTEEICKDCGWSIKRKAAMKIFGIIPSLYVKMTGKY